MEEDLEYAFKLVVLGGRLGELDSNVGKTGLLTRFVRNEFNFQSKPTIGVDFFSKTLNVLGKKVRAQIWDTAGQERFRAFSSTYFQGANGAILVYDVTNRDSFESIPGWLEELDKHICLEETVLMLVGNKTDLDQLRQVRIEEAKEFAKQAGMFFMETSAKEGGNDQVARAFLPVVEGSPF